MSAERIVELGLQWYARGQLAEAAELFEAAQLTAAALAQPAIESAAWTHLGRASWLMCEPKVAEHAFGEAVRCCESAGDRDAASRARVRQAFMAYDSGDLERAERLLDAVQATPDLAAIEQGMAMGYRANVARSRGRLAPALGGYEDAIAGLESADEVFYASTFRMDTAVLALLEGDAKLALERLAKARVGEASAPDPILAALIGHYELLAYCALGQPRLAAEAEARFEAPSCATLDFIAGTHADVLSFADGLSPSERSRRIAELRAGCPPYEHGRLTIRILRQLVGVENDGADQLIVREDETRLQLGRELEIRFAPKSAEWRMVQALVRAREAGEPYTLSRDALIATGWPDERMSEKSARNRLHVALSNLRKRGLREVLLRHHDGYALSRAVRIVRPRAGGQSESA